MLFILLFENYTLVVTEEQPRCPSKLTEWSGLHCTDQEVSLSLFLLLKLFYVAIKLYLC